MRPSRPLVAVIGAFVVLASARVASTPRPRVDLGSLRVVVLQSDDWGLEGWFPDADAAAALSDIAERLPRRMRAYATSSLESAADVESVGVLLAALRDADGLPPVLQANTITSAIDAGDADLKLRGSGASEGAYARPGLARAVDAAIAAGVWWPELHGLTHFDLEAYGRALRSADPLAARAATVGTVAYGGWQTDAELAPATAGHAEAVARQAVDRFRERFKRAPLSVIAPDYVWGDDDERAWRAIGLQTVQAKEEQVDPSHPPLSLAGRIRKVLDRWWDMRRGGLHYLGRPAELEPYGDPDPACEQGCADAAGEARAAWAAGQPAIVGIHRVQLSNLDPRIAAAGRAQLRCLLGGLEGARFLVDEEVRSLQTSGRSRVVRGGLEIHREVHGGRMRVRLAPVDGGPKLTISEWTRSSHVWPAGPANGAALPGSH